VGDVGENPSGAEPSIGVIEVSMIAVVAKIDLLKCTLWWLVHFQYGKAYNDAYP
jgi:hypothetical protein